MRVAEHIADPDQLFAAFTMDTRQLLEQLFEVGDGDEAGRFRHGSILSCA